MIIDFMVQIDERDGSVTVTSQGINDTRGLPQTQLDHISACIHFFADEINAKEERSTQ